MKQITQRDLIEISEAIINNHGDVPIRDITVEIKVTSTELKHMDEQFYMMSNPDKKIDENFKYCDVINLTYNNINFYIKQKEDI